MRRRKKYCHTCKINKPRNTKYFYWDSTNNKFESQCRECRLLKQKIKKRVEYNPLKERQRHLKRRLSGEFLTSWKKWRDKFPEKYKARYQLRNAVKAGKIKQGKCEVGTDCIGRLEAHHHDYKKPFDVKWLCHKHHKALHYPTLTPKDTK